jgi:hypothetical protein
MCYSNLIAVGSGHIPTDVWGVGGTVRTIYYEMSYGLPADDWKRLHHGPTMIAKLLLRSLSTTTIGRLGANLEFALIPMHGRGPTADYIKLSVGPPEYMVV